MINAILLMTALLAPVQSSTTTIPLGSSGPQQYWNSPTEPYFINARLTIGDVNGDDVPDFVFSNQLGYLEIFSFPTRAYTGTPTRVTIRSHGLPAATVCSGPNSGGVANLRRRSLSVTQDELLIYDIDLDGVNEIICTDLATDSNWAPEVGLCIIDVNGLPASGGSASTLAWQQKAITSNYYSFHAFSVPPGVQPNVASIASVFSPNTTYFQCGDKDLAAVKLRIANIRGTSIPQDILVYNVGGDKDFAHSVYSYSNGSGSTPNKLDVSMYVNPGFDSSIPHQGEPGHTRLALDLNGDGKDEVIGRHVFEYVPNYTPPVTSPDVQNGRYLWSVENLDGYNQHIDHLVGGDILKSVRVETAGGGTRVVASPGVEMAMCPQFPTRLIGGVQTSIDGGSIWIYRGISGHNARWPRKLINHDPQADFYTPYNALAYSEPHPSSNWQALGTAFGLRLGSPIVGALDPQDIIFSDFLDSHDGPELIVLYKSIPRVTPSGWTSPNLLWRLCGSVFGTDPNLTAHNAWFNFGSANAGPPAVVNTLRNGPGAAGVPIDFRGTRDEVECTSVMTGLIRGIFPNNTPPSGVNDPFHKMIFEIEDGFTTACTNLYELYPANSNANGGETWFADSQPADMLGDSREEYVIFHHVSNSNQYLRVVTSTDGLAGTSRVGQPSPYAFIDYQWKRNSASIQYRDFDRQHVYKTLLPVGQVGQTYGSTLDRAFWSNPSTPTIGAMLIPEGGVPPYTVSVLGDLQAGLTPSVCNLRDVSQAGAPIVARYQGAICIQGIPTESGKRKLTIRVVDSLGTTTEQECWVNVVDPLGPASDPRPYIMAGGFDGAVLQGGAAQDLILRALVADPQNDVLGVAVLDPNGNPLGITALDDGNTANGDLIANDGVFSAKVSGIVLPPGFALNLQMVAFDAASHLSPTWPYMSVEGGPGGQFPEFDSEPLPAGQPQDMTPTIDYVYMPPHTIPAAETTDAVGVQGIVAVLKYVPPATKVTSVLDRVRSHVPGVDPIDVELSEISPGSLVWAGTFAAPIGEIGYGRYSVNVRARTEDSTGTGYLSDWWPNLRWH